MSPLWLLWVHQIYTHTHTIVQNYSPSSEDKTESLYLERAETLLLRPVKRMYKTLFECTSGWLGFSLCVFSAPEWWKRSNHASFVLALKEWSMRGVGKNARKCWMLGAVGVVAGAADKMRLSHGGRAIVKESKQKKEIWSGCWRRCRHPADGNKKKLFLFFVFRVAATQSVQDSVKAPEKKNPVRRITMADKQSIKPAPEFFFFFFCY